MTTAAFHFLKEAKEAKEQRLPTSLVTMARTVAVDRKMIVRKKPGHIVFLCQSFVNANERTLEAQLQLAKYFRWQTKIFKPTREVNEPMNSLTQSVSQSIGRSVETLKCMINLCSFV